MLAVAERLRQAAAASRILAMLWVASARRAVLAPGAIAAGMLKGMVEQVFPITLGRDFAGTLEAVGDGVTAVAVGDEVFGVVPAA
jgi:Zn-dependent alcohol dehydrogenase